MAKTITVGDLVGQYADLRQRAAGFVTVVSAVAEMLRMEAEYADSEGRSGYGLRCLARELEAEVGELESELKAGVVA